MDWSSTTNRATSSPSRKRKASANSTSSACDNDNATNPRNRRRTEEEQPAKSPADHEEISLIIPPPMEDDRLAVTPLLSVPLELIFRTVTSGKTMPKPLLTSAEARCLLSITMLAQELDECEQVAMEALTGRSWSRALQMRLVQGSNRTTNNYQCNPFLRSLLPPLVVHGTMIPNLALDRIMWEIARIMVELQSCANVLRQFSEQNWNIAESLFEAMGGESQLDDDDDPRKGAVLAREKRMLSDIQEEVCNRIESLIACGGGEGGSDGNNASKEEEETPSESQSGGGGGGVFDPSNLDNLNVGKPTTMSEYCTRIMPGLSSNPHSTSFDANNERQPQPEVTQNEHRHHAETQQKPPNLGGLDDPEHNGGGSFSYGSNSITQQQQQDARSNMVVEVRKEQRFTPAPDHDDDDDITEAPSHHEDAQRDPHDDNRRHDRKDDSQLSKHGESVRSVVSSESETTRPDPGHPGNTDRGETQQAALEALTMLANAT